MVSLEGIRRKLEERIWGKARMPKMSTPEMDLPRFFPDVSNLSLNSVRSLQARYASWLGWIVIKIGFYNGAVCECEALLAKVKGSAFSKVEGGPQIRAKLVAADDTVADITQQIAEYGAIVSVLEGYRDAYSNFKDTLSREITAHQLEWEIAKST